MSTINRTLATAIGALLGAQAAAQATPPTNIVVDRIQASPVDPAQPSTTAITGGTRYTIGEDQGYRPGGAGGQNLLQSFSQFTLGVGDEALFTADPSLTTKNIISRVTGGTPSEIHGRIASDVAGANLYLLNPAGIMFGPTASLDVQGSFHASTADVLRMRAPDGSLLSAFSGSPALALAHPAAFGFVNTAPAAITVNGATLTAADGKGLSLVGGDVQIGSADTAVPQSVLNVKGGRLQVVAAGAAGDVAITEHANGLALDLPASDTGGRIDVERGQLRLDGAGEIGLQAGTISLVESNPVNPPNTPNPSWTAFQDSAPEVLSFSSVDGAAGGDIVLRASSIILDGARILSRATSGNQSGPAGSIVIEAESLTLGNLAAIEALAIDGSLGGSVTISARQGGVLPSTQVLLDGRSVINTDAGAGFPTTQGGELTISGFDLVRMTNQSQIRSDAYGSGSRTGNVRIDADRLFMSERSEISSGAFQANQGLPEGQRPGSVFIVADSVELRSGASIESISITGMFNSGSPSNGGDVVMTVRTLLAEGAFVDPSRPDLAQPSGISSTIGFSPNATGGNILINVGPGAAPAESIQLLNGGRIAAESVSQGKGGQIQIRANRIVVSGVNAELAAILEEIELPENIPDDPGLGSVLLQLGRDADYARSAIAANSLVATDASAFGLGGERPAAGLGDDAGTIRLTAGEISLDDGGLIGAFTEGVGAGGRIEITTDRLLMAGGAQISSDTTLNDRFSDYEPTAVGGRGGDIAIKAGLLRMTDEAEISSDVRAGGTGAGGNVYVEAGRIELLQGADGTPEISTDTAGPGAGGNVVLVAREELVIETEAGDDAGGVFANSTYNADGAVASPATGAGAAGGIYIAAGKLSMAGGAIAAATFGSGQGGDVYIGDSASFPTGVSAPATVQSTGTVSLNGDARISVRSTSTGNAGDVTVEADQLLSLEYSSISTQADESFGGNVSLASGDLIYINRGQVTAATEATGVGNGGNVTMTAPRIAINEGLVAASANAGNGGNIGLTAGVALLASAPVRFEATGGFGTVFDATSSLGVDGQVNLAAPDVNLDSGLAALTTEFLDPSRLLRPSCDAGGPQSAGSFAVRTRAGAPVSPEELLVASAAPAAQGSAGVTQVAMRSAAPVGAADAAFRGGKFGEAALEGERAVRAAIASGDPKAEAAALGLLGNAQTALGDVEGAQSNLMRGIKVAVDANDTALAAELSNNLGNHWSARQDDAQALEAYRQSARLAREAGDRPGEARALANAARAALRAGQASASQALLADARALLPEVPQGGARTDLYIHLARSYTELAEAGTARGESLLAAHGLLAEAARDAAGAGDARAFSYAVGNTGRLYELEGRTADALFLTRHALRAAEDIDAAELQYRWHWQAARLMRDAGQREQALAEFRRAVELLEESRQETLARYGDAEVEFRRAVAPVYRQYVDLLLREPDGSTALAGRLQEARGTMELLKGAELRDYFRNACIAELEARTESLDAIAGSGTAVIYPVLLDDRLELLVSAGGRLHRARVDVPAAQVESAAQSFRGALQAVGSSGYRDEARQLYDWIVRPIEPVLAQTGARTLVFVPGGALRAIPMAALLDGDTFLIERYATAVTPSLNVIDPKPLDRSAVRLFAAGISESVQGQPALPAVPEELAAIEAIFGGESLLNAEFEAERVGVAIREQRPTIVHIASHGVFAGDPEKSFLLAYDGPLTMERLSEVIGVARFREDPLALLVLSACQTAEGDDRAALGLAGVAIRAGARSAMGSLWSIADDAAVELVKKFYGEIRNTDASRAEALRQAQLSLLEQKRFEHPFFWSPFLMINNWL